MTLMNDYTGVILISFQSMNRVVRLDNGSVNPNITPG